MCFTALLMHIPTSLLQFFFGATGELIGVQIRSYALNLTCFLGSPKDGPGAMHIFSLLLAAPKPLAHRLQLDAIRNTVSFTNARAAESEIISWLSCLEQLGLADAEREQVVQLLAAVMHLGSIDISASADHCFAHCSQDAAHIAAQLLQVESDSLTEALTVRSVSPAANSDFDRCTMPLYPHEAVTTRDGLGRLIFTRLFRKLASYSNALIQCDQMRICSSIIVVDFCGLEAGKDAGLERLCSHYCLEKQHEFIQSLRAKTPLEGTPMQALADATDEPRSQSRLGVLCFLEEVPVGLLNTIERLSNTPDATAARLFAQLAASHSGNNCWRIENSMEFTLHHFGGAEPVSYNAQEFLGNNKSDAAASWECRSLLQTSECALLQSLIGGRGQQYISSGVETLQHSRQHSLGRVSVCRELQQGLAELFTQLKTSRCSLVCCIRTAAENADDIEAPEQRMHDALVLGQLRLMEVGAWVAQARLGRSCWIGCDDVAARFGEPLQAEVGITAPLRGLRELSPGALCTTLALSCGLEQGDFWIDKGLMFYRSGCSPLLQRLSELTVAEAMPALSKRLIHFGELARDPWTQRPPSPAR